MNLMKCSKCNHEWNTKSKLKLVTCPSCGLKIKNTYRELKGGNKNGKTASRTK
jgi:DNA-directed RNA polymerase subunit RPC12/RpoP